MAKAEKTFEDISKYNYVTKDNVDHVEKALLSLFDIDSFMLYPDAANDLMVVGIKSYCSISLSRYLPLLCNGHMLYLLEKIKDMTHASPIEFSAPAENPLPIEDVAYYLMADAIDLKIVVISRIIDAVLSPSGCKFGLFSHIVKFNSFEELMVQGDLKC